MNLSTATMKRESAPADGKQSLLANAGTTDGQVYSGPVLARKRPGVRRVKGGATRFWGQHGLSALSGQLPEPPLGGEYNGRAP